MIWVIGQAHKIETRIQQKSTKKDSQSVGDRQRLLGLACTAVKHYFVQNVILKCEPGVLICSWCWSQKAITLWTKNLGPGLNCPGKIKLFQMFPFYTFELPPPAFWRKARGDQIKLYWSTTSPIRSSAGRNEKRNKKGGKKVHGLCWAPFVLFSFISSQGSVYSLAHHLENGLLFISGWLA